MKTDGASAVRIRLASGCDGPPFCRPFDLKKEETQAARMADWFYVVGLSQNEEIARRDPGHVHRFLIELICKEHLNPNFNESRRRRNSVLRLSLLALAVTP
jgi:hypothetical protein